MKSAEVLAQNCFNYNPVILKGTFDLNKSFKIVVSFVVM